MTTWVLILFVHAGALSMSITSVPGFSSPDECRKAGSAAESLAERLRFVCVEQKR
jgi:hypothetical protein